MFQIIEVAFDFLLEVHISYLKVTMSASAQPTRASQGKEKKIGNQESLADVLPCIWYYYG